MLSTANATKCDTSAESRGCIAHAQSSRDITDALKITMRKHCGIGAMDTMEYNGDKWYTMDRATMKSWHHDDVQISRATVTQLTTMVTTVAQSKYSVADRDS